MQDVTIIMFAGLLVGSNIYWAVVCHRLVNKVMSRNYAEYLQSENVGRPRANKFQQSVEEPAIVKAEQQRAEELNKIMGMI